MAKSMGPGKKTTNVKAATAKEEVLSYVCPHCGVLKKKTEFYVSSDPAVRIGIAFPCKACAEKIARGYNERSGKYSDVTETTLKNALCYLDKPFLNVLYEASYAEVHDDSLERPKTNMWAAYIKNVQMKQYNTLRWRDSDFFKDGHSDITQNNNITNEYVSDDVADELDRNRKDVIRLIGYDPFEKELEEDKPLLYAQLIGYLDADGNNDDMTRILDSIEIVRGYLQLQKLNDMSAKAFSNLGTTGQSGEIKNYMDTKKKVADVISQLAEQSCISLKHNKNASKGENTWTGKIKKIKELNLREGEVNGFDIATCKGMQQVMDLSNASILKQLALDESEYSNIIAEQRKLVTNLTTERDSYREICRILLRENLDLKDVLSENDLLSQDNLIDLNKLFSVFGDIETDEEVQDDEQPDENQDSRGNE